MNCELYQIRFSNGKYYFGISKNAKKRFWDHTSESRAQSVLPVHRAMRKYPHEMKVLCVGSREYVGELEAAMISRFGGSRKGYNVLSGRENGALGLKHSQETKDFLSNKFKGRKRTPESIKQTADARRGKLWTPEMRVRGSESQKRRVRTPEEIARIRVICHNRVITPEYREKLSTAAKARWARQKPQLRS